jgi:hypothetical protein
MWRYLHQPERHVQQGSGLRMSRLRKRHYEVPYDSVIMSSMSFLSHWEAAWLEGESFSFSS